MFQDRQLALPSYLVAFSLAVLPPLDQLLQTFPFRIGDARWRFGAFGLLSSSLLLATVGFLLALVATSVFEHRRFRRIIGAAALTVVLGLAAGGIVFALDALQVRSLVSAQAVRAFTVACIGATIKTLLAMLSFAVLGISAFRGPKRVVKPASKAGLIVSPAASRRTEPALLDVPGPDHVAESQR